MVEGRESEVIEISVPELGDAVARAQLGRWLVADGAAVKDGDLLLELETDKVSLEVVAPARGVLEIVAQEGGDVIPGQIIGRVRVVDAVATSVSPRAPQGNRAHAVGGAEEDETATLLQRRATACARRRHETSEEGKGKTPSMTAAVAAGRDDLTRAAIMQNPDERRQKLSPLRQAIAHNLKTTQNTAAILSTFNEIDMSAVKEARTRLKAKFAERNEGAKLGFMSFFARAVAVALQDFPVLNAYLDGDEIVWRRQMDLGIAIGAPQGLVVPVLRDASRLSFGRIEHQIADFAVRAKERKLTRDDLMGATFTITNGGVFGSMLSTPLLGPRQTGVLGLHSIKDRVVPDDGKIEIRPIMYVALSYDHRLLDGKDAVRFLARIKELIEDPVLLMVDHI